MVPRLALLAVAALAWAALAGAPAAAQTESAERLRIAVVTHGAADDPFWEAVKEGAERAASDTGVDLVYRAPAAFDLDSMASLVQAAVEERPAGLVVSVPNADALAAPLRSAADAGIPVITINSGFDVSASLGALLHVGQSEYEAGRVAGEAMRERGGTKALCLNHELGNVALDLRCKGFIDGFGGSVEVLPVDPNAEAAGRAIGEKLAADRDIDVVLALNAALAGEPAVTAATGLEDGRTVRVGTFDITDPMLEAVADGRAAFAIDQQPFLQGYLPVQYLALLRRYGVAPVSNVSTGPKLVTAEEAARRLGRAALPPEAQGGAPAPGAELPVEQGGG